MDFSLLINISELLFTMIGVVYGIILFFKSNIEKKNSFVFKIYDKFYNDKDISKIIYYVDRDLNLDKIKFNGDLEIEADKTLRLLDLIGKLLKDK
jgi:hypothetical protein